MKDIKNTISVKFNKIVERYEKYTTIAKHAESLAEKLSKKYDIEINLSFEARQHYLANDTIIVFDENNIEYTVLNCANKKLVEY